MRSTTNEAVKPPTPGFAVEAPVQASQTSMNKNTPTAVIGPKIRFKGELVGEEDLLIQGQIDGTIDLKGNNLTIGNQGVVKANVLAKTVTVEGNVEGDIFGQERIAIRSSSNVRGNLVAERVTLEDGARFRGSIDMDVEAHKAQFQKFPSANTSNSTGTKSTTPGIDTTSTSADKSSTNPA